MWAEHQNADKPTTEESAEKSSKRSTKKKKERKPKGLQPPQADGDLLKSTDQPASGWDSPSTGTANSDSTGSSNNNSSAAAGTTGDSSSSPASSEITPSTAAGTAPTSDSSTTTPRPSSLDTPVTLGTTTTPAKPDGNTASSPTTKRSGLDTPVTLGSGTSTPTKTTKTTVTESSSTAIVDTPPVKTEESSSSDSADGPGGPMQPLCKLTSLKSSDFVKSGGWPGVGPFAQDQSDSGALVDDSKNRLKLKLVGDDVTHAELLLVNQSPKPSPLLALQMTADFLLEAVGALPGKIADFNTDMMKNQEKLAGTSPDGSVNLKAGTYVVQIQKKPAQESTVPGNVSYLIALDNQKPSIVASASSKSTPTSFSIYSTPTTNPTDNPTTTAPKTTTPKSTTPPKTTTSTPPVSAPSKDDLLHRQFSNLISSWQQVKRSAVKTRQSASLTRILGGNALATQNRAIEWLIENKRFYEMTPVELKVQTYKEISPGAKYEIETYIKERRQLVSADTMKVEKDTTQAYNVVYTVEKIRGAWLITDTRMVKPQ